LWGFDGGKMVCWWGIKEAKRLHWGEHMKCPFYLPTKKEKKAVKRESREEKEPKEARPASEMPMLNWSFVQKKSISRPSTESRKGSTRRGHEGPGGERRK